MPKIIPISDLKNTTLISDLCHESREPIFITKNGKGDLALMSITVYDEIIEKIELYKALARSEDDLINGRVKPAKEVFDNLREKYFKDTDNTEDGEEVVNG